MTSTVLTDVLKAKTTNGSLTISGNGTGNVDMKNLATTDDTPMVLTLKTGETDIAVNDVLGQIDFQAPDEATGTDAILVAAGIAAVSEGDFSSSNNATKLSFKTAASAAAAETASLSSTGVFTATSFTGSGAGLTAGTTPITTLDIDGGTDIGAAVVAADLFVVDDGAGGTNRKTAASRLKTFVEASAMAVTGNVTATGTVEPAGDTAAGDNSALGYTSVLGAILTGQGSTNDVTLVNDADATVLGIATGTTNVDIVGDLTAGTLNADGDTAAGDNAAIGYTAAEGLILTGQGSTNDVTVKNDADTTVFQIPTGTSILRLSDASTIDMSTPLLAGADHTYTGLSAQMLAGGAISAFDLVCIHTTTQEVVEADASAYATARVIGIAPAAISDTATGTILLHGFIRDDTWAWTAGSTLYLSETAGAMTHTAPSTDGAFVQVVGVALSPDVVYMNPSMDVIEHA
jgi:hypothetical protein